MSTYVDTKEKGAEDLASSDQCIERCEVVWCRHSKVAQLSRSGKCRAGPGLGSAFLRLPRFSVKSSSRADILRYLHGVCIGRRRFQFLRGDMGVLQI
jgi:hypothetical protein